MGNGWAAAGAGVLAGTSVGLRSLGIPVAAGIGLLLLCRRRFRLLFWFCLTGLPLTLFWSWPTVRTVLGLSAPAVMGNLTRSGWTQTVCFYSSYACDWKRSVPDLAALWSVIKLNLFFMAREPGVLLLRPLAPNGTLGRLAPAILLSAAAYVGIARSWRRNGCRPLHAIFPLYFLAVVFFPYGVDRYAMPFAPLFFAGLWLESNHLGGFVKAQLSQGRHIDERVGALLLGLGALALAGIVTFNYAYAEHRQLMLDTRNDVRALKNQLGAYNWIREHALPHARVIAFEDGLAYLYTGRPSIPQATVGIDAVYLDGSGYALQDAAQIADVARHVGASYWLTTPYDDLLEKKTDRALLLAKRKELLAGVPVLYRSPDGSVTLYDTRCLWAPAGAPCSASSLH